MAREFNRKIVFEDGSEYPGYGFGSTKDKVCTAVFNSSVVGYQEIVSDPSYADLAVVMTYPVIGSYGIAEEDFESKNPALGALIVREYNDNPSNFRYVKTLAEILQESDIPAIEGVDTRKITRFIRDNGSCKMLITDIAMPTEQALALIAGHCEDNAVVSRVSCGKKQYARTANPKFSIAAVDCGIKHSVITSLNKRGCNLAIMPYNSTAEMIEAIKPDGVLISSGPGNAENIPEVAELIRALRGKYPICGIGIGAAAVALAYGVKAQAMEHAHRGGYAVRRLSTNKLEMTSQNHGEALDAKALEEAGLCVTHINVVDETVEGFEDKANRIIAVQYHPESAPGPEDSGYIFDEFITLIKGGCNNA